MSGENDNVSSSAGRWTESEKLKVLFSLIKNDGHVNWSQAYIPPGRSLKAVKCMIDVERKKADSEATGATDGNDASAAGTSDGKPKRKRATPAKKKVDGGGDGPDDTPTKPAPKKRAKKIKEPEVKAEPEDENAKQEATDTEGTEVQVKAEKGDADETDGLA